MARDVAKYNIRINTICPSMTDTDMAAEQVARRGMDAIAKEHPLGRMGEPIDMANAALYLASDRLSWVTGNSLFVDGGACCKL
jgi:NAD(P)-dependent dehydrogenase (short-subunit alcohol dehydrogenase family)